jgi:hypothetical protein
MIDGVHYLNCGDWVESATALVETHDGELKIIHWGVSHATQSETVASNGDFAAAA